MFYNYGETIKFKTQTPERVALSLGEYNINSFDLDSLLYIRFCMIFCDIIYP